MTAPLGVVPPHLGTGRPNRLLFFDYGPSPAQPVCRLEIDIRLDGKSYELLEKLFRRRETQTGNERKKTEAEIMKILLSLTPDETQIGDPTLQGEVKAGRHMIAAAFDREPR